MICKVSKLSEANSIYAVIDFDSGGDKTFSIPLTDVDGQAIDPPTHFGANTVIDAQMDTDIKATGPTITKYFEADGWTWETALNDMWLQVFEVTI